MLAQILSVERSNAYSMYSSQVSHCGIATCAHHCDHRLVIHQMYKPRIGIIVTWAHCVEEIQQRKATSNQGM